MVRHEMMFEQEPKKIAVISHCEVIDKVVLSQLPVTKILKPRPPAASFWRGYSQLSQWAMFRDSRHPLPVRPTAVDDTEAAILELEADLILTCDAPLISTACLDALTTPIINIHFGISRRYRGSHTLFWPLLANDFDHLGVTIHHINSGIDTGAAIVEYYPELRQGDTEFKIWRRIALRLGELLPDICSRIASERPKGTKVELSGRLYLARERTLTKELQLRWQELRGRLDVPNRAEKICWL